MMNQFFGAANTESGFFSFFDEIFSPKVFRRIYILKGGPGTGKSTLMRKIGLAAEEKGYAAEYIFCSSDPKSLDGVIIPALSVAILDGTAPHMTDPVYPGAVERIIDLGDAFHLSLLAKKREMLLSLIEEKKKEYQSAYRYLSAAGCMEKEREERLSALFLYAKADAAAKRLVSSLHLKKGKEQHRYLSAMTSEGTVHLDTLSRRAKKIYAVTDSHGLGYFFMERLYRLLHAQGVAMTVCPEPLIRTHSEAIFAEGEDILFIVTSDTDLHPFDKRINCNRFVSKEALSTQRRYLRFSEKCRNALLEGAFASLGQASALHAKAENIYAGAIDFSKVDAMTEQILSEIFANNM